MLATITSFLFHKHVFKVPVNRYTFNTTPWHGKKEEYKPEIDRLIYVKYLWMYLVLSINIIHN